MHRPTPKKKCRVCGRGFDDAGVSNTLCSKSCEQIEEIARKVGHR